MATIDYKKKYEQALERARQFSEKPYLEDSAGIVEYIFPELKESEDEKIRKNIIATIHLYYGEPLDDEAKEMIAWLEKQGEQKQELLTKEKALKNSPFVEQKPTDKVEPKFHKGEWLCENEPNNYARFIQILEIVNVQGKDRYRISRDIHKDEDVAEFRFVEKYYHKFDIQDAKDGDVLVSESNCGLNTWYCIFKSLDGDESMTVYCYLARDGRFETKKELCFGKDPYNTNPATKEQRDTLIKAMADAGYTFDFEKKELKEIEQKSAWSEEEEKKQNYLIALLQNSTMNNPTFRSVNEGLEEWLKSLKCRVQPQNKWKESLATANLENSLCDIQDGFSDTSYEYRILGEAIEFIRCTEPKPQWKPSEEQMEAVRIAAEIGTANNSWAMGVLKSMYQDLKKLMEE